MLFLSCKSDHCSDRYLTISIFLDESLSTVSWRGRTDPEREVLYMASGDKGVVSVVS
jgi:hypothetical protein